MNIVDLAIKLQTKYKLFINYTLKAKSSTTSKVQTCRILHSLASPSIGQVFEPESHSVREKQTSEYSWKDEIPPRFSMFNSRVVAKPSGS